MALTEFNLGNDYDKVALVKNTTVTAVSGGATTLGGTYGVRLLVDDTVALSKQEVLRAIEVLEMAIIEGKWPIQ